jgi:hypothetical protein
LRHEEEPTVASYPEKRGEREPGRKGIRKGTLILTHAVPVPIYRVSFI